MIRQLQKKQVWKFIIQAVCLGVSKTLFFCGVIIFQITTVHKQLQEKEKQKELTCNRVENHMPYTNISKQPAMLHFPCVKSAYIMSSTPLCTSRLVKRIVFGLGAVKQSSFVIPHSRAAIPNDIPPSGCLMKTKALFFFFWEQSPVWKELRPCVSECVKEAGRWRRDDTGLKAEEQRVVVRRMNSDWRSAQWQLNDLRSVDSVSINQTALSRSPCFFLFFFPSLPLLSPWL